MPKTTVTTTATTEVNLSTRMKAQLRVELANYCDIRREIKRLEATQKLITAKVQAVFVDNDEVDALMDGADLDGVKVKLVCGKSSRLDKKKLLLLGCKQSWLDKATVETDNKPYVKISSSADKDENA